MNCVIGFASISKSSPQLVKTSWGEDFAKATNEVAATAGIKPEMVRHYGYLLAAEGLVEVSQADNVKGYVFFLTPAG